MRRPSASVAIAVTLPLLLAVVVAGIGIAARLRGSDAPSDETGPLAEAIASASGPAPVRGYV